MGVKDQNCSAVGSEMGLVTESSLEKERQRRLHGLRGRHGQMLAGEMVSLGTGRVTGSPGTGLVSVSSQQPLRNCP